MKLAIIPARGGSKRIKNKNIVDFCGKPLISYSLEIAEKSGLFDHIHVSTEDTKIKEVVENLGFSIEFMRDPKLADDFTGVVPVLKWVVDEFKLRGKNFTEIALIMPTSPLVSSQDIKIAYEEFIKHSKKFPVMSCSHFPVPVDWAFKNSERGTLVPISSDKLSVRSQDLPDYYFDAGAFSFLTDVHIREGFKMEFIPYLLPTERAVDIDNMKDLHLAEILYLGHKAKIERDG